jgi:tetratricopeptide (TPR) repeat protein
MAVSHQNLSVDQAINVAMRAFKSGNYDQAATLLQAVLKVEQLNGPALHLLSLTEAERSNEKAARHLLHQSLIARPEASLPWVHFGISRRTAKSVDDAIRAFRRALWIKPLDPYALAAMAGAQFDQKKWGASEKLARTATVLLPTNAEALSVLSVATKQTNKNTAHIACLNWARVIQPRNIELQRELAAYLSQSGDTRTSEIILRNCLSFNPGEKEVAHDLAVLLYRDQRIEDAENVLLEALTWAGTNPSLASTLAKIRANNGKVSLAIESLENLQSSHGLTAFEHERLGTWLLNLGCLEKASAHLEAWANWLEPGRDREIYFGLSLVSSGDLVGADQTFQRACDLGREQSDSRYRSSTGDMLRVSPAFHSFPSGQDPILQLPDIRWVVRQPTSRSAVYLSLDGAYFDRFRTLILRNLALTNRPPVHLHVIDPKDEYDLISIARENKCALTVEDSGVLDKGEPLIRAYYSCVRFPRVWALLKAEQYQQLAIVDVDGIWRDGLSSFMEDHRSSDVCLFDVPSASPWFRFNASITIFSSSEGGLIWLGQVARHIAQFLVAGTARWRLDQCALFSAWITQDKGVWTDISDRTETAIGFFKKYNVGQRDTWSADGVKDSDPATIRSLAQLLHLDRQTDAAIVLLESALESHPGEIETLVQLCDFSLDYADWERAERHLEISSLKDARLDAIEDQIAVFRARQAVSSRYSGQPVATNSDPTVDPIDDPILKRLSDRLAASQQNHTPFRYRFARGLLDESTYEAMSNSLPDPNTVDWGRNPRYPDRGPIKFDGSWGNDDWKSLVDALTSQEFVDLATKLLEAEDLRAALEKADCILSPTVKVTVDRENYYLGPHRDHVSRFASLLIYMPKDNSTCELGTSLYRPIVPMHPRDHGKHHSFEQFEKLETFPFLPNSGVLFLNFGDAYHGVQPVHHALRPMIQSSIYIKKTHR